MSWILLIAVIALLIAVNDKLEKILQALEASKTMVVNNYADKTIDEHRKSNHV